MTRRLRSVVEPAEPESSVIAAPVVAIHSQVSKADLMTNKTERSAESYSGSRAANTLLCLSQTGSSTTGRNVRSLMGSRQLVTGSRNRSFS